MINFSDINVQVAFISGGFSLLSTIIAGVVAQLISQEILNRKKLKKYLSIAVEDIEFLLQVEKEYGVLLEQIKETTHKKIVRQKVRKEGYKFSGKFTPGRARDIDMLK